MNSNDKEPGPELKLDAPKRVLRRYLPSREVEPEELSPFGITESETGAKVNASSVRNFNTFSLTHKKQQWITLLNEKPSIFLKTASNLDDTKVLSEELDRNADMIGIPLRDPDPYYIGRNTYITLTKERDVQRFSSHPSLGIFSPNNPIRKAAISIVCSAQFQALIVSIVILDFVALIFNYTDDPIISIGGELFFAIYCAEIVMKLIAYGFVIDSHSFLRSGHSIVELIVVVSNIVPVFVPNQVVLKPLRVIRVIRLFRLIGALKYTRKIMKAVVSSGKDLVPVFVLFVAIISIFSLVSLVFYKSSLLSKCVEINYTAIFNASGKQASAVEGSEVFYKSYLNWTDNSDNWKKINDAPIRCTVFHSSAEPWMAFFTDKHKRKCPKDSSCLMTSTGNPDMGYSNYDTLMLSMLSTFRLLCQDWWDNLFVTIALTNGGHQTTMFFLLLIFLGSHYVLNLVLSTITLAYQRNDESEDANMEERVKLAVIMQINRDNKLRRQVEVYNQLFDQGRTLLTEPKYLKNLPEEPVSKSSELETYVNTYVESYQKSVAPFRLVSNKSNLETVGFSPGVQAWLDQVLRSIVVRNKSGENLPIDTFINVVILMNVIEMLAITPVQKQLLQVVENNNVLYTIIFTFEAILKLRYQRTYYLRSVMNQFDLVIVVICLIEMMVPFANSRLVMILRMTRFLRLFKLARVSKELERLITVVLQSFTSEIPLIILSFTIVIISAGIGMVMFQETYHKYKQYQKPTQNFVDIYNSVLLVFRIMCGEWIENLWVCMKIMESGAEKGFCVAYFLINQIIVSLVIFKLYIGILLNKFSECRAKAEEEKQLKQNEQGKNDHEKNRPRRSHLKERIKRFLTRAFGINFGTVRRSSIKIDDTCFGRLKADLSAVLSNNSSWYGIYIIIMTILSSTALILDDYYLKTDPALRKICDHLEVIFLVVFGTEMVLKIFSYGPLEYCKSPWRILDAAIVITTMADMIVTYSTSNREVNLTVMRVFRTLRCLRILRTANIWQGFKLTISALFRSVRRLFFAFIIVLIVWLMFALVSTSLFSHKFYRCVDNTGSVLPNSVIKDKTDCLKSNNTWQNKRINFDSTFNALLALLEISVFKGWIDIFQDISNAPVQIDLQPDIDNNSSPLVLIYIFFIIIGSFFMMGMLIGVIVDSFEEERKKLANVVVTESQKKMQNTLKQCLMFPLNATKPKPDGCLGRYLYELNKTIYVEVFYLVLILTSTVVIALQYYPGDSELLRLYLPIIDDVLLLCFVLEIIMKILAEGTQYLVPLAGWNLVDFIIVILSAIAEVSNQQVGLQFLRVIRFARVLRMGRLLAKSTNIKTVRDILLAMVTTLPSMLNMIALLIMAICIFAIVGVNLFSEFDGNSQPPFNEYFSFRTFFTTWRMLFIVSTAAGFNDYLDGTMRFPWPYSGMGIAFWVTYLCLSFFVLTNLIVSAVVSSYNEVFDSESSTVKLQTAEAFTKLWNDFDQCGTGRMHVRHISELLDLLSEPLRIQQPNSGVIGIMMIPLSEDYHVNHAEMVKALVKEILDHMGIVDDEIGATQENDLHRPILDTMIVHKLRMATQVIKIAWWQRKIRHHVVGRLQGKQLSKSKS